MTGLLITMALGAVTVALYAITAPLWAWVAQWLK
jgi:hypothetical protein